MSMCMWIMRNTCSLIFSKLFFYILLAINSICFRKFHNFLTNTYSRVCCLYAFFYRLKKKVLVVHNKRNGFVYWTTLRKLHFGWTIECVSLLTIQFRKLKSTCLGSGWLYIYIGLQYTFHVFHLFVFVYCTCAKLNLSPPKNVETWLHCCSYTCERRVSAGRIQFTLPIVKQKTRIAYTYALTLVCVEYVAEDNKFYLYISVSSR